MSADKKANNNYEVVILVHPDATLEEQKEILKKNKATIESYNGSIFSLDTWGKRTLANPIGKSKKAVYFHATFSANPQAILELERLLGLNEKVLRFMHSKLDSRIPLSKFVEAFKKGLAETSSREKDREAKIQARKAAAKAAAQEHQY